MRAMLRLTLRARKILFDATMPPPRATMPYCLRSDDLLLRDAVVVVYTMRCAAPDVERKEQRESVTARCWRDGAMTI